MKRIGLLLKEKDRDHLGMPKDLKQFTMGHFNFEEIQWNVPLSQQGTFDLIIHKISDFIKNSNTCVDSARIISEILEFSRNGHICLDNPQTVLDLADRLSMFKLMTKCTFEHGEIKIDVPRWVPLLTQSDISLIKQSDFQYPIICKALCAGEGPGCHSMQLVFVPDQLDKISVFPCIAQEFKNHNAFMVKIFLFGSEYFVCTRPSVRNFPINGAPIDQFETIKFDSHEVAKSTAYSFLNNFRMDFVPMSSIKGDKILDDEVVKTLLNKISSYIDSNLLGIDVIVTDDNKTYNLVDVNYLPSYEGIDNRFEKLTKLLDDYLLNGGFVKYW